MRARSTLFTFVLLLASSASVSRAVDLPRYKLPVGRKLTYSTTSKTKDLKTGKETNTDGIWELTVVRENPDGSRRIILRTSPGERDDTKYIDIFDDGRSLPNDSLGPWFNSGEFLPLLPKDETELLKGWSQKIEAMQETITFAPPSGTELLTLASEQDGIFSKLYLTTRKSTYRFDSAKGTIVSKDEELSQKYGFQSIAHETVKLEKDETISPDAAKQIAADYEVFFTAKEKYREKMLSIQKEIDRVDAIAAEAKSLIVDANARVTTKETKEGFERILKSHDDWITEAKEDATKFGKILNKPSPDWSATDIDGKPLKLADLRGKVVVMDFWYRGCGWCMLAMPQVKQLAEDFKDKSVVVLGMNTDKEEKDARAVIDGLKLSYPTVKATGIPEKYGIRGFPTLVMVDQAGVVREIHVGYSPTLRADLAKKIDELLAKPAVSSADHP